MWVYPCFEGDVDMARAWVQHDLYFPCPSRPYVDIFGGSTADVDASTSGDTEEPR